MTDALRSLTLVLALVLAAPLAVPATEKWPPMLPPRATLPPPLAADIDRVWTRATIVRNVEGERARAPLDLYATLIDTPEIATAAARHLQLARYDVRRLGPDRFFMEDGVGAQGEYQVLVSDRGRRVMFSRGRHTGRVVGTVSGIALTDVTFEVREGHVVQRLTAWVLIENRFLAVVARIVIPFFGQVVDRKLQEGFRVTARVAEWAAAKPAEFCDWLAAQPYPEPARQPVRTVAHCRPPAPPPTPPPPRR